MADLARILSDLVRRIVELERRTRGQSMEGRVSDVDAARGLYRVELADGFKTGWIPARSQSTGALKLQAEPTEGQMVTVRSESGDLTDAAIDGSGFAADRPRDKNGELFASVGDASLLLTAEQIVLSVGGAALTISSSGITIVGESLTHNGKNVGDTHTHGGVQSGGSNTSVPN